MKRPSILVKPNKKDRVFYMCVNLRCRGYGGHVPGDCPRCGQKLMPVRKR